MCVSSLPFGRGWLTLKEVSCMIVIATVNSFPGIRFLAGAEASQMSIFELPNGGDAVGV